MHHYKKIHLDKLREAVALNKYALCFHAREGFANTRGNLIVSGNRLSALDIRTGKIKFTWPESQTAGIRGMGRGLVAGDEIFWPTRHDIYVIHGVTGARSRTPIRLGTISDGGANLAAADGRLIVAGHDKIMAFGPALPMPPNRKTAKPQDRVATSP